MKLRGKNLTFIIVILLVGTSIGVSATRQVSLQKQKDYEPGEVVVGFQSTVNVKDLTSFQDHAVKEKIIDLNTAVLTVNEGTEQVFIEHLTDLPSVRYAEYNWLVHASLIPNDPRWNQQWGPQRIHCEEAWDSGTGNSSIVIAIVDTGIDYHHEDIASHYTSGGYDWVNSDTDPMDDNNHGTHCAGIAAAVMNNAKGIAGVAQVNLLAEKILNSDGQGTASQVANGITHAADHGADVISMSFGATSSSEVIEDACSYAYATKNMILVAASGNDGKDQMEYPAGYDTVIAVGATDQSDQVCDFSNYGSKLELVAPGYQILSTVRNNQYDSYDGTSMACPHVSGVAALALSKHPGATNVWIRELLDNSAEDLGAPGKDIYFGFGLVDARLMNESDLTEVDQYANQYYQKDSGWHAWNAHGMECDNYWHPTRNDYIYYSFTVPQATPGPVLIGAEFKASSVPWNHGPDIDVYDPIQSVWTKVQQGMGTPSELTWKWYTIAKEYISGSSVLRFRILCAAGCDTWLDTVGVKYAPLPPAVPDLTCSGSLSWTDVKPGSTVSGSFSVGNIGDPGSKLNWQVQSWPSWGSWTFTPSSGRNLPKDGTTKVMVTVVAPDQENQPFNGAVKVVNTDNIADYEVIPVNLITPCVQSSKQQTQLSCFFDDQNYSPSISAVFLRLGPNQRCSDTRSRMTLRKHPLVQTSNAP
ncbi:MAG TPA: S8 family peptidase [Candidatus Thermoplasmatota archaeon]|nr:S8 family peptidase [Candidatus Thermoplasmatota archaeon]